MVFYRNQFMLCMIRQLVNLPNIYLISAITNNIQMQASNEKKLIQIFKMFVEKSIVPQIRKLEGSISQWVKFSSLLLVQNPNYNDLQIFVDSLPIWGTNLDKPQFLNKKSQGDNNDPTSFNPSKTFGGDRSKINIFPFNPDKSENLEAKKQAQKEQSHKQKANQNNNLVLSNLERLLKNLQENQRLIDDNSAKEISSNTLNRHNRQHSFQHSTSNLSTSNNLNNIGSPLYLNGSTNLNNSQNHTLGQNQISSSHQLHQHNHSNSQPHNSNHSIPHMPSTGIGNSNHQKINF